MSSSKKFEQAIEAGNISEAFLVAMSNAPELSITTKIVTAEGERVDRESSEVDNYLRTHINLVEGKVENEIGAKLTGDRYSEIKQFHIEQVTQAHQTIQHNLISLQKIFQLMSSFQQQNSDRSNWVDVAADVTRKPLPSNARGQLQGDRTTNALQAEAISRGKAETSQDTIISTKVKDSEPQPLKAEDDSIVDNLLSLSDINDNTSAETAETHTDWSEGSEDKDLKSLDLQNAATWQNWESENEAVGTELEEQS